METSICSIVIEGNSVFVAAGSSIYQYIRGRQVGRLSCHSEESASTSSTSSAGSTISEIIISGAHICALTASGRQMHVFALSTLSLHTTIDFPPSFTAIHLLHPSTYLNKVVIASREGGLQLWNISTRTLIHTFKSSHLGSPVDALEITCVVQSPAIDVIALGFTKGRIIIFDIRLGETLLQFNMSQMSSSPSTLYQENFITALSFRTDNLAQTLASSDSAGNIAIWDLDSGGKLMSVLRRAHDKFIAGLKFLPGQPVLVSAGSDNAVRVSRAIIAC